MKRSRFPFTYVLGTAGLILVGVVIVYSAMHANQPQFDETVWGVPGGEAERGRQAIIMHGCGACHVIPGIRGATGRVGPQLSDLRNQVYLAGILENTPENLADWIRRPQHHSPGNAMPDLPVSDQEALDMAAYLYTMRR